MPPARDGNQSRAALEGTVHLVGVEVGLEALVMSFFYREVLSAVLVVVSISCSQSLGCTNNNGV